MAATGSTTTDKTRARRNWLVALLPALLAASALLLAWPRLQAALVYLPAEAALDRYFLKREISSETLAAATARARRAVSLHDHPRYWNGLVVLAYLRAIDRALPLDVRRQQFEQVVEASGHSLTLAPVQPSIWLYRARAQGWLSFRDPQMVESLKMSVYTGRIEPELFVPRLSLAYGNLRQLDDEALALLRDQTLLAWELQKAEVVRALKQGRLSLAVMRYVLGPAHAPVATEMEAALAGRV